VIYWIGLPYKLRDPGVNLHYISADSTGEHRAPFRRPLVLLLRGGLGLPHRGPLHRGRPHQRQPDPLVRLRPGGPHHLRGDPDLLRRAGRDP
jgi:hypothetical protein